jgi:tRNA(Ile)-lysidine synthase
LARAARHCAEASNLLENLLTEQYQSVIIDGKLSVSLVSEFDVSLQKSLLRYWIKKHNYLAPSEIKLQQIIQEVMLSRIDASPCVAWEGVEVRRYRGHLYVMKSLQTVDAQQLIDWSGERELVLPTGDVLSPQLLDQFIIDDIPTAKWTVRFRSGGEKCRLLKRDGTRCLKKLFQEWGVPPWQRQRIPLLYLNDQLMMVVGYCSCVFKRGE